MGGGVECGESLQEGAIKGKDGWLLRGVRHTTHYPLPTTHDGVGSGHSYAPPSRGQQQLRDLVSIYPI